MAEEHLREPVTARVSSPLFTQTDLDALTDEQYEAKAIDILERGAIGSRVSLASVPGWYREWVSDDSTNIARMKAFGFKFVSTSDVADLGLHSDATDKVKVGDVVLMEAPQRLKDLIEKARSQRFADRNLKRVGNHEEISALNAVRGLRADMDPKNLSEQSIVDLRDVRDSIVASGS